jgi:lysyl-tRNA synthetase class 2
MVGRTPWWDPRFHADRRPLLAARGRIAAGLRGYFGGHGFTEVEAAILQVSPGNEAHLHAFVTDLKTPEGGTEKRYLHTSPEFACKKLLAAGETRIFDFARVFRNRERGPLHHPEFTMLEWYRANESYDVLIEDCAAMIAIAATATGATKLVWRGREADPFAKIERITVAQAFSKYAGVDLLATVTPESGDRDALARETQAIGINVMAEDTWADLFSRILVAKVEPNLGIGQATVLDEYPAIEAALARRKSSDPRVAERFELYACGVELANAFGELTDAVEQRRRFEIEMAEKQRVHGERYPIDEDFLAALAQMPPACGIALGFDRLVMLATGAPRIEQVMWTPLA